MPACSHYPANCPAYSFRPAVSSAPGRPGSLTCAQPAWPNCRGSRHTCRRCGEPLHFPHGKLPLASASPPSPDCRACRSRQPRFARAYATLLYAPPIDRMVLRFKAAHLATGGALAHLLCRAALRWYVGKQAPDVVIPVPLEPGRQRQRGFNQAGHLAAALARAIRRPLIPAAIRRRAGGTTQKTLGRAERLRNLRGAFDSTLRNQHVPLVDDVYTTGATAEAVIHSMPGCEVDLVTLARTPSFNG